MLLNNIHKKNKAEASLTVEAALVLPIFIYFFIALIYFLQILIIQEHIQASITNMGLGLAKATYVYDDFTDAIDAESFDTSLFGLESDIDLKSLSATAINSAIIKQLAKCYLDADLINKSCVQDGMSGISFNDSSVLNQDNYIDIVVRYRIRIPISLFGLEDMRMIQRIRLRGWNGHQVPARYSLVEEGESSTKEQMVYITKTGTVYHIDKNCSHISLSIETVTGVPTERRNKSGGKYHPCEVCCKSVPENCNIFYITSYGDRYHSNKNCSGIKRTVQSIPISEVGEKSPCKRCGKKSEKAKED